MAAAQVNVERLRRELLVRGWTGLDLACHSGVSPATVSAAVQRRPVSVTTVRKMALALSRAAVIPGAEELLA